MGPEAPRAAVSDATPVDEERLVRALLAALHTPRRDWAVTGLCGVVVRRVLALATAVTETATNGRPVFMWSSERIEAEVRNALFPEGGEPIRDLIGYYMRAAEAVRKILREGLSGSVKEGEFDPVTLTRLVWWEEFHRVAGLLPPDLRPLHDLWFYARLTIERAAAVLGKDVAGVTTARVEVVRRLRPILDKARGKA